ncbi:uncharacterized protein LOC122503128 [Leptopilina heterotoma]|uniref:uncharacterized protein LOC122503128 n=1 Tax=Leptopilina heterotoma TaxID=63436 RepID=UPI001CAA229C|nr:uncharacterized protein LOC122503128 [Leptopilina heterotoma]
MQRKGTTRGRSKINHHPEREFQYPTDLSTPPSWLDFPIVEPERNRQLGAIPRQPKPSGHGNPQMEIATLEDINPSNLPRVLSIDENSKRRHDEDWAEFESRLAVQELDRFMKNLEPKTSVSIERLRERQVEEVENRKTILKREEVVRPNDEDEIDTPRSITPPGPPNRLDDKDNATSSRILTRRAILRKTTERFFNDMESIPTDPTLDPPPRTCYNCWRKGHNRPN